MMMADIAMHILDIGMNSIKASASFVEITILDSKKNSRFVLEIKDNGTGMNEEQRKKAIDPFYTTRTTRKIGLGLSFLKAATELCGGSFELHSTEKVGTTVIATFCTDHWDCPPIGDMGEAIMNLCVFDDSIHFILNYQSDGKEFVFDTTVIQKELDEIKISDPGIMIWLKQFINEEIKFLEPIGGIE